MRHSIELITMSLERPTVMMFYLYHYILSYLLWDNEISTKISPKYWACLLAIMSSSHCIYYNLTGFCLPWLSYFSWRTSWDPSGQDGCQDSTGKAWVPKPSILSPCCCWQQGYERWQAPWSPGLLWPTEGAWQSKEDGTQIWPSKVLVISRCAAYRASPTHFVEGRACAATNSGDNEQKRWAPTTNRLIPRTGGFTFCGTTQSMKIGF